MSVYPTISIAILLAVTCVAQAGQQSTTINVSAELVDSCSISIGDFSFGQLDADVYFAAAHTQAVVDCPENTSWSLSLGPGQHLNAATGEITLMGRSARQIHHSQIANPNDSVGGAIAYDVSISTPLGGGNIATQQWGDGITPGLGNPVTGTGQKTMSADATTDIGMQTKNNPAGLYTDTLVVTLDY